MYKAFNKGFTLIELLVVIAIIGILASVVLVSLNSARGRGGDAAVKANLSSARAQAELYYDTNGNYTNVCTGTGGILTMASSTAGSTCLSNQTAWALSAPLVSTTSAHWCVDSTGKAIQRSSAISGTSC